MNPNPAIGLKGFKQGHGISAKTLNAMGKALFHARGTNGVNVRWEGGNLVVEGATESFPFRVSDVSIPGDGWHVQIEQGYFSTANQATQGTQWEPTCADVEVYHDTVYLYMHAAFDSNELLTGTPELVILESTDPVLTADTFTNGYLQLAKMEKAGTAAAPSLTITQYVETNLLHRKINLTHLWSYGAYSA